MDDGKDLEQEVGHSPGRRLPVQFSSINEVHLNEGYYRLGLGRRQSQSQEMKRFRERMMAINMWVEARFRCGMSVWDRMSTAYQVIWIIM